MILVRDLMTPAPFCLRFGASRDVALRALLERHLHGAPVVDREGLLAGVISVEDLAAALLENGDSRVEELMTRPPVTIDGMATLYEAARLMVRRDIHRLVVVAESGRPVGLITPLDILTAIVNLEGGFRVRAPEPDRR